MSVSPPTKPPRGVKQGKETSGLLMSVIRTLSASETNEQREKERAKLEKEYKKSDTRLDELVAMHADDIQNVMQKFNQVSTALAAWGQHCDSATARLTACRSLLQLRRDDLKRLWALSRTHHYALNMLTDISRVVTSESECRATGDATRVLSQATSMRHALDVAGRLAHVTALSTTREHLQIKKNELVDTIVRQISNAVYHDDGNNFTRQMSHRRTALLLAELTKPEELTESFLQEITPEFEASLTDEDRTFETNVMICLEALAVLEQLREATEKFKVQIQDELLDIIDTVSRRIMDTTDIEDPVCEQDNDILEKECASETGKLARLLAVLADEFRACGARNKRLIQLWRATLQKHKLSDSCLHSEQHYWSAVQQVLQLLLTEYLDICRVNLVAQRENTPRPQTKLTEYFAKKRVTKRTGKLFHFINTGPPTMSVRRQRYPLVCAPHPAHLYSVLPTIDSLCNTINNGGECSLRAFITDYIRTGETERLCAAARRAMAKLQTDCKERATVDNRVVFRWAADTWRIVHHTVSLLRRCTQCTLLDASVAHSAIRAAMLHCNTNVDTGTPPSSRASKWLSDDDIVRFLKSLPNWKAVQNPNNDDNSEELTQSYEREAEILGTSLADGAFSNTEIVTDVNVLTDIALYMESMAWLSVKVRTIPASLSSCGMKLSDKFLSDVAAAAEVFDDKCNKNLLFLHLEFRIQCFQLIGQEEGAAQLSRTLLAFNENTSTFISPQRRSYILCGVAEMMSRGLLLAAGREGGAGGAGAEGALAAARHCLAALALPHAALRSAHAVLPRAPQEILRMIREEGPQFTELEYMNVFKIIGERQGLSQAELQDYYKQLSAALGNVGVTV